MKTFTRHTVTAFLILAVTAGVAHAGHLGGIGVLGDSYSDEYQFYPPDRTTARNWVEILAEARGLDFGRFSSLSRGEPRNQGFEYNWARSDATTDDLIAAGQHTGLAAQVARGDVTLVYVCIGGNDYIHALQATDPAARLADVHPRALRNFRVAVRTILEAHPGVKVVLTTLPDIRHLPEFADPLRDGTLASDLAESFSRAMREFNAEVRSIAASDPRVALIDFDLTTRLADLVSLETISLFGLKLDRRHAGNDLEHFFLADRRHPGTLGMGLMAQIFLNTINHRFNADIPPLSRDELIHFAARHAPAPRIEVADTQRPSAR